MIHRDCPTHLNYHDVHHTRPRSAESVCLLNQIHRDRDTPQLSRAFIRSKIKSTFGHQISRSGCAIEYTEMPIESYVDYQIHKLDLPHQKNVDVTVLMPSACVLVSKIGPPCVWQR